MSPARLLRTALFVALASASTLAYLPACSSKTDEPANSLTAGVLREGDPSDAAVTQLLSYEADDWGWAGGVYLKPPTDPMASRIDVTLPADTPFTFVWHADPVSSPEAGAAGSLNAPSGSGFTGVAFLLVFSTPSNPNLLRVVTTDSSFTPSADAWKMLTSSSEPVTLKLASGTFENDELVPEGGPHQGQALGLSFSSP